MTNTRGQITESGPIGASWAEWTAFLDDVTAMDDRRLMLLSMCIDAERRRRAASPPEQWEPWAVAVRSTDVRFMFGELPDGIRGLTVQDGPLGAATVILDSKLSLTQLGRTLVHELIHVERGVSPNWSTEERAREEAVVDRLAAQRLDELG